MDVVGLELVCVGCVCSCSVVGVCCLCGGVVG